MEGSAVLTRVAPARPRKAVSRPPFVQRYWAFLSYSHVDTKRSEWLHRALERVRIPPELVGRKTDHFIVPHKLTPIFRDRSELAASGDLSSELREAIECSRHLIVICSPAAAASHWVNEEIRSFKRLRRDGKVLAAIVDGVPGASDPALECMPVALCENYDSRGRLVSGKAEPIAADLRAIGDGRDRGVLKLVAGMLDLRLDELVQRHERLRHRRWMLVSFGSVAGMALTSGLAVAAVQARDEARYERRQAESLIGFMIGDLKDKLEPVGRLEALDAVGGKVLAYYEQQDTASLSNEALAQRSRALTLMGEIAAARGDLGGAQARYREAMAGTAEAIQRTPRDPLRLFDHAQNVFWVGSLAKDRGDLAEARNAFATYRSVADQMVAADPRNPKWRMETIYADVNLGTVLADLGRSTEAAELFQASLKTADRLINANPRNIDYQEQRMEILAWLADAQFDSGLLSAAIATRRRQVTLIEEAVAAAPTDMGVRSKLVGATRGLGRLLVSAGLEEDGIALLRRSKELGRTLLRNDPTNARWRAWTAGAELNLAQALRLSGKLEQAGTELDAGCSRVATLTKAGPNTVELRKVAVDCLTQRAQIAFARGAAGKALVQAGQAMVAARQLHSVRPAENSLAIIRLHRLIGEAQALLGDVASARGEWQAALSLMPASAMNSPRFLEERAALVQALGHPEAGALRKRLAAMGFHSVI